MNDPRLWRWLLRHRRLFHWPVFLLGLIAAVVCSPLMVLAIAGEFAYRVLRDLSDWFHVAHFWIDVADDSPALARMYRVLDNLEERRANKSAPA